MTITKLNEPCFGYMIQVEEPASPLPLEHTQVTAQLVGQLACVAVTQHFINPFNSTVELKYLFPLPHEAALIDFEMKIGERLIRGDIQEIREAQKIYAQALEEGKVAGLLEERRPNLFAVSIANVEPGKDIQATLRYQHRITYQGGNYEFVFPMGITPKYGSPSHPDESEGVEAPIAASGEKIGAVEISAAVDAGTAVSDVNSPSHRITVEKIDERRFNLRLADSCIPDHDFVLRYGVARQAVALSGWRSAGEGGDYFMATLLPPALEELTETPRPREFIFVLDRSGSMTGEPIAQARNALRACLRTLNENDTFRILLFDDRIEWYRPEPSPVSQAEIDAADRFIGTIEGRGGTEIVGALNASLSLAPYPDRTRFVIFLTDGAVSAEERALGELRQKIGKARLFTFGIGPSVNRALLSALARLGRGMAEFLQLDEDIEGAILRFQDRVSFPVLTDIQLNWKNGKAWDVYPAILPDLYVDQPLELCGRLMGEKGAAVQLTVDGSRGGQKVSMELSLPALQACEGIIQRVWARNRLDDLLEQHSVNPQKADKLRSEIISFALENRLVSPHTAFIAVDSIPTDNKSKRVKINIAQPLPEGLDIQGFLGQILPAFSLSSPSPAVFRKANFTLSDASFMDLDLPMAKHAYQPAAPKPATRDPLKQLARTQRLDGSWDDDIEMTIAAVFCYIRRGQTTSQGSYRKQVKRALDWLLKAHAGGFSAFALARLLTELASLTGLPEHDKAAANAMAALPEPKSPLEEAALRILKGETASIPIPRSTSTRSLDVLRMAGLANIRPALPSDIDQGVSTELVQAWADAIYTA